MSRKIRVIFIILSIVFLIFSYRVVKFYVDNGQVALKDEPEAPTSSSLGYGYYSFMQDGSYGIINSQGKVVADALYANVSKLSAERFLVSRTTSEGLRYGIIDNAGNITVPFIYKEFRNCGNEVLIAETADSSYVLFDSAGNSAISGEWDNITKNYPGRQLTVRGNYIQLEKNGDIFRMALNDDGSWFIKELVLFREIMDEKRVIKVKNYATSSGLSEIINLYTELYDRTTDYINAVFSNDSAAVKNLSWNDDYHDLLLEGLNLRGGTLTAVPGVPEPLVTVREDGTVDYSCTASLEYTAPDDSRWDGSYTYSDHTLRLEIHMKKRQNGKLAITKVYASKDN